MTDDPLLPARSLVPSATLPPHQAFADAGAANFATLEAITEKDLDEMFGVNVVGTVLTVKKAIPLPRDGSARWAGLLSEPTAPNLPNVAGGESSRRATRAWWNTSTRAPTDAQSNPDRRSVGR